MDGIVVMITVMVIVVMSKAFHRDGVPMSDSCLREDLLMMLALLQLCDVCWPPKFVIITSAVDNFSR